MPRDANRFTLSLQYLSAVMNLISLKREKNYHTSVYSRQAEITN